MKERKVYVAPMIDLADIESGIVMTSDLGGPSAGDVKPPTIEDNSPAANDADNPNVIKGNVSVWD